MRTKEIIQILTFYRLQPTATTTTPNNRQIKGVPQLSCFFRAGGMLITKNHHNECTSPYRFDWSKLYGNDNNDDYYASPEQNRTNGIDFHWSAALQCHLLFKSMVLSFKCLDLNRTCYCQLSSYAIHVPKKFFR